MYWMQLRLAKMTHLLWQECIRMGSYEPNQGDEHKYIQHVCMLVLVKCEINTSM